MDARNARISVRDALPEDAGSIAALSEELAQVLRRAGNPVAAVLPADVIRRDGFGPSPAFSCLLCEVASEGAVGYALVHPAYDPDLGGRILMLVDLYVRRSARRMGAGTLLVRAALERAASTGARALAWWIRERNQEGIAFYRSLGADGARGIRRMHLAVARGGNVPRPTPARGARA